ncbi:hypothetical protein BGX27_010288 [Mortierella sp. AM989]|nr:hypothetical protein BGX27_010288 [Mortierella sp. AM989]
MELIKPNDPFPMMSLGLTKTTTLDPQLSLILLKPTDFIPELSPELNDIKDGLLFQLQGLAKFLAERNTFIFSRDGAREYGALVKDFLIILQTYIDTTLVDLLRMVGDLSSLMGEYNKPFDRFIHYSGLVSRRMESSIKEVQRITDDHRTTIENLGSTALRISDLIEQYKTTADNLSYDSAKAMIISIGVGVSGLAAKSALVVAFPPAAAFSAVALISSGSGFVALYDKFKSEIYNNASKQLGVVDGCNKDFQSPISNIYAKLHKTQQHLTNLKYENIKVAMADDPEDMRKESYIDAQEEAKKIKSVCEEIRECATKISILKGKVVERLKQV